MNYQEIKDLLSSGFTPDQITQLATISGVIPSAPDSTPENIATAPAVESPAEVGEDPETVPSPTETDQEPDPLDDLRKQVQALQDENKKLQERIQANNIRDRTIETVSGPDASEILGEIIRPSFKKVT